MFGEYKNRVLVKFLKCYNNNLELSKATFKQKLNILFLTYLWENQNYDNELGAHTMQLIVIPDAHSKMLETQAKEKRKLLISM